MQDSNTHNRPTLLHLAPNTPTDQALEHAANLLACINELTLDAAMGESGRHSAWAAHYLGDVLKVILDETLSGMARTNSPKPH